MKKPRSLIDKASRQSKNYNQNSGKAGKLTKDGLVYKNNLLGTDTTSQNGIIRKTK